MIPNGIAIHNGIADDEAVHSQQAIITAAGDMVVKLNTT